MCDWPKMTLGSAGIKLLDCDHKTPSAEENGYPYVGIPQMTTGRVVFDTARKISHKDFITWTRKTNYQTDDIVLSRRTNPGVTAIDDTGTKFALGQNLVLLRSNGSLVYPPFLRWLVHTPEWWTEIDKFRNVGAIFSSLRCGDIPNFELTIPPIADQISINSVLRPIEDKIELNRQMNKTLEEMARELFRDWFVDFGPTHRQMAGETDPTKIMGKAFASEKAAALALLFPGVLGENGLPEGWEERPFEAFVEIVGGGTPKTKMADYWNGRIPWFSVADAPSNGGVYVLSTEKYITQSGLDNSSARIVPEGTTIISARGTVGKIGMAPHDMTFNQSCYALRPRKPVGERFVYLATERLVERLQAMAHGSVFSTITRSTFASLNFAGATPECFEAFETVSEHLFAKIKANGEENQTLAFLRDLLLPKLMSGEIRLKDAEGKA